MIRAWRAVGVFAMVVSTVTGTAVAQPQTPRIVFMLVDNPGDGELGVYGGGILRGSATPRIDALAGSPGPYVPPK